MGTQRQIYDKGKFEVSNFEPRFHFWLQRMVNNVHVNRLDKMFVFSLSETQTGFLQSEALSIIPCQKIILFKIFKLFSEKEIYS